MSPWSSEVRNGVREAVCVNCVKREHSGESKCVLSLCTSVSPELPVLGAARTCCCSGCRKTGSAWTSSGAQGPPGCPWRCRRWWTCATLRHGADGCWSPPPRRRRCGRRVAPSWCLPRCPNANPSPHPPLLHHCPGGAREEASHREERCCYFDLVV